MTNHFISVLGTGLYEPVVYFDDIYNDNDKEWEFVQFAIIDKYKEQLLDDGRITIFVTNQSNKMNYLNRTYSEIEAERASKWKSREKDKVKAGAAKIGFAEQFRREFPELADKLNVVEIPSGENEDEIWEIFNELYSQIGEEEEILFDVTHAFRSIPIIMMSVMNYVKVMKSCVLGNISYGAFEAARIKENQKYVQMVNLTYLDEILDWSNAANEFMKYGNSSMIKSVYDVKFDSLPNEEKKNWRGVKKIVDAMSDLSNTILTCRGNHELAKEKTKSILGAYNNLAKVSSNENLHKIKQIKPLFPLFEKTRDAFRVFDKEKGYQTGLAVVEWSIQNNMVQQGYTALEESLKTFMCDYYDLNQFDKFMREDVCSPCTYYLTANYEALRNKRKASADTSQFEDELRVKIISGVRANPMDRWINHGSIEETLDKVCEIIATFPFEFANQIQVIKDERNDINHFGMRKSVISSNDLFEKLDEHNNIVSKYIESMIQNREEILKKSERIKEMIREKESEQAPSVFLNYSNHPYLMWSQKQKDAAKQYADSFEELAFPAVSSSETHGEIEELAKNELEKILKYNPKFVMCQGEFTLTYRIVELLKRRGVTVLAACSERKVEDVMVDDVYSKQVVFEFVQFREY